MKTVSIISTILQWVAVGMTVFAAYQLGAWLVETGWTNPHQWHQPDLGVMPGSLVVLTALCFAFTWVKVWRVFPHTKPFKCLKCMTGWTSLVLAFLFHTPFCLAYVFIGLFTGAMVDALINKYL
jgi:hypothetical protein